LTENVARRANDIDSDPLVGRHHPRMRVIQYSAAVSFNRELSEYWVARSSRAMTLELARLHPLGLDDRDGSRRLQIGDKSLGGFRFLGIRGDG
jgi:hypothetical protein